MNEIIKYIYKVLKSQRQKNNKKRQKKLLNLFQISSSNDRNKQNPIMQYQSIIHYIFPMKKETSLIRDNRQRIRQSLKGCLITPDKKHPSQIIFNIDDAIDEVTYAKKKLKRRVSLSIQVGESISTLNDIYIMNSFDELFTIVKKIGQGSQSVVYECIEKDTGDTFAAKTIKNRDLQGLRTLKDQYRIMKTLSHPNIIKAYYLFINEKSETSHLVCENCNYKDLRFYLNRNRKLKEANAAQIISKLLEALVYIHEKGICHRDIKPENILYDEVQGDLKIIDFQISKTVKYENQKIQMWSNTGTLHYKAPQMFQGIYNQLIDIWSVGVICYEMMTGRLPFHNLYSKQTIRLIIQQEPKFDFSDVTISCINFIKKCLDKNPLKRPTALQILKSPFLLKYKSLSSNSSPRLRKNSSQIFSKKEKLFQMSKCYNENEDLEELRNIDSLTKDTGVRVLLQ